MSPILTLQNSTASCARAILLQGRLAMETSSASVCTVLFEAVVDAH